MAREVRRGDVWYAELPHTDFGGPQSGPRPCVICQAEEGSHSHLILVAPLSASIKDPYPFLQEVDIKYRSQIHYEHLGTINRDRLQRFVTRLTKEQIREMDIRMSVPIGLSHCNYLHIESIKLDSVKKVGDVRRYRGTVYLLFGKRTFEFTSSDLWEYLGKDHNKLNQAELDLVGFLETLKGLKFLYDHIHRFIREECNTKS